MDCEMCTPAWASSKLPARTSVRFPLPRFLLNTLIYHYTADTHIHQHYASTTHTHTHTHTAAALKMKKWNSDTVVVFWFFFLIAPAREPPLSAAAGPSRPRAVFPGPRQRQQRRPRPAARPSAAPRGRSEHARQGQCADWHHQPGNSRRPTATRTLALRSSAPPLLAASPAGGARHAGQPAAAHLAPLSPSASSLPRSPAPFSLSSFSAVHCGSDPPSADTALLLPLRLSPSPSLSHAHRRSLNAGSFLSFAFAALSPAGERERAALTETSRRSLQLAIHSIAQSAVVAFSPFSFLLSPFSLSLSCSFLQLHSLSPPLFSSLLPPSLLPPLLPPLLHTTR